MHSKQQETHGTFYVSGSQHRCFPSGDESLKMSKLDVRHFQATDRLCMPLAYLAHSYSRLKHFFTTNDELDCKVQDLKNILMSLFNVLAR
jgi:hypothetical protein